MNLSLSRVQHLLRLHIAEQGRSYLISLGLSIGGMLALMLPLLFVEHYSDLLYTLHPAAFFGVLLGSSLFTSTAFSAYSNAAQGIPALMLPASRPEKFLVILLANLCFVVLVFALFLLLHYPLVALANQQLPPGSRTYQPMPSDVAWFFGYMYFIVQGFALLGSIYFPKNAYIKTLGIVLVVAAVAFLFNWLLAYQFTGRPQWIVAFPFTYWNVFLDRRYVVDYPEPVGDLADVFLVVLVVALWYIAYVRLREKEI